MPGTDNLLKGHGGYALRGCQLLVKVKEGTTGQEIDAPGNTMELIWFNPGEKNPYTVGDPMDAIGENLWA